MFGMVLSFCDSTSANDAVPKIAKQNWVSINCNITTDCDHTTTQPQPLVLVYPVLISPIHNRMQRPSSCGVVSDERHHSPLSELAFDDKLPMFDPQSEIGKKEAQRLKFPHDAVHLIPILLILSGVILWCFSSYPTI
ncbi:hypothetical protein LUZ61_015798 [Rhynchospora tenuis]|uniref:Transmembrane protein n=1 Tax=Rhynchospora tenuis TaxID=198213 RepID=A0AAD5Z4A5_9POAL|nr:hypothetical protein LUZ61_015798 [Rhynchospora tenuis]